MLAIRDFVYLDVERLKSILSQLDEGLVESAVREHAESTGLTGDLGSSLFGLLKASGGASVLWNNSQSETRTLHDHIYELVERTFLENALLTKIPADLDAAAIERRALKGRLHESSFILVHGFVTIDDYGYLKKLMNRFNELAGFISSQAAASNVPDGTTESQRKALIKQAKTSSAIDKDVIAGFNHFFDLFYVDRVMLKVVPDRSIPNVRISGPLLQAFMRDETENIIFKYGTAPATPWTLFAQVCAIPSDAEVAAEVPRPTIGPVIDLALGELFTSLRGIETMGITTAYPEVAVTPIALYRTNQA